MVGQALDGLVGIGLLGNGFGAPKGAVAGDHHDAFAVLDAAGQGIGGEAAEHHGMDGSDSGEQARMPMASSGIIGR
jgi:hypothetical protein